MFVRTRRCLSLLTVVLTGFFYAPLPAQAADSMQGDGDTGTFSATGRQADLVRLRDFVYPKGYSDQTIVSLENGEVPADLPVVEYARLHCGETNRFVMNPCIIRYGQGARHAYYVVTQDGNMHFSDLASATAYYRDRVGMTASKLAMEVDVMNMFVDEFCTQLASGVRPADILRARGGEHPRINNPIAPPNPRSKYQFSNLFSWERCKDCVGIIAINQPEEQPPPTCGSLRKQGTPHIAYFVVDRATSKGNRSIDESIREFVRLASRN
jgi:hypothetical protein